MISINQGEIVIAFDILLGDALFVDRMTYNFIKPKVGTPAVFRTASIDDFNRQLEVPAQGILLVKTNITLKGSL